MHICLDIDLIVVMSSSVATAGDSLTLSCTVAEDVVVTPFLQWLGPDDSVVSNTGNPSVVTSNRGRVSTVRFLPLRTSHGGSYSCRAIINNPGLSTVQSVQSTDVIVQSESPALGFRLHIKGEVDQ